MDLTTYSTELAYAAQYRFSLLPVSSTTKLPLIPWKTKSSADPWQWAKWGVDFPNCNFAINCAESNIFLLDTDVARVGQAGALLEMDRQFHAWGMAPPAAHCRTQSGGLHHYFWRPRGCPPAGSMKGTHKLRVDANGHEILGLRNRGIGIAPGSSFGDRRYELLGDIPPHPCPPQIVEILQFQKSENVPLLTSQGTIYPSQLRRKLAEADQLGAFESYEDWYQVGMALRLACGDSGFDLWLELTRHCDGDPWVKWCSFDAAPVPGKRQVRLARINEICARVGVTYPLDRATGDEMFGEAIAAYAPPPGSGNLPPGPPVPARQNTAGASLFAGQAAIVERGAPILAGFLAAQLGRPHADAPRLPESMVQHGLQALLNDAVAHVVAMAERQRQALLPASITDVLGVLANVHPETSARVVAFVGGQGCVLPERSLSLASRQFENEVRRDLRAGAGYRTLFRTGIPDPQNADNVAVFLKLIGAELRFNDWTQRIEIRWREGEWRTFGDPELNHLRAIASQEEHAFRPAKEFFRDMLSDLARQTVVDPVLDYIDGIKWDGQHRLVIWLSATCGVPCDRYHQAVGKNIIGGMVRRARQPGCKHDEVAIFIGKQGLGKSPLCKILARDPAWFTDSIVFDTSPQNLIPQMSGKWVAELAELDAMARREVAAIKRFLSAEADNFTAKYATYAEDRPRRLIFTGTSNDDTPLRDETGNRRFLPVKFSQLVDLAWLRANIDQLIAEAAHLEAKGETFAIPPELWGMAAERQEAARAVPAIETQLEAWFSNLPNDSFIASDNLNYGLTTSKFNPNDKIIPVVLRRLRFERDRLRLITGEDKASIWVKSSTGKYHPQCTRYELYQNIGCPVKIGIAQGGR
jgi:hypothetical protein